MRAMILAAGLGTRFRPYTDKLAKPAIPFLNIPLGLYPLFYLEQLGLKQLVVNLHHLPDTVRKVFDEAASGKDYQLSYSDEVSEILGSGGGIWKAQHQLFANVFSADEATEAIIANGDEVVLFDHGDGLKPLVEEHRRTGALATLLTTHHPGMGTEVGGAWTLDGEIKSFGKDSPEDGAKGEHFTGFYIISSQLMSYFPDGESHIFYDVLMKAIGEGRSVRTFYDPNVRWYETGNKDSFNSATEHCLSHLKLNNHYGVNLRQVLARYNVDHESLEKLKPLG